ncbi:hypothetical protein BJX61DRAFT_537232 [Aspergillus egyptiacus]|nr:hypothetical protein BJX61DRAFT_537232 [Aspergillus egyptiacus]
MDNGSKAIARIPHPVAGPRYSETASEVKHAVSLDPRLPGFCLSADVDNPVQSEYIIMKEALGEKLEDIWDDLSLEKKVAVVKDLVSLQKRTISVSFNSLYYATEAIRGTAAAEVVGDVPVNVNDAVMRRFVIGPVAERSYWSRERATMKIDRGPYFVVSIAHGELEWIKQYAVPRPPDDPLVSMIDWQDIWAEPLTLQVHHPRLVDYHRDIILKAPENFKQLQLDKKSRVREQMSRSILLYLDEKQVTKEVPLLDRFVGDTWDDDPLPLRESLIWIEKYWKQLGYDFPCPIHFTQQEIRLHEDESEGWNDVQDFWESVSGIVSRDGWTPTELYDDSLASLRSLVGKQREDFKRQTQWVEMPADRQGGFLEPGRWSNLPPGIFYQLLLSTNTSISM